MKICARVHRTSRKLKSRQFKEARIQCKIAYFRHMKLIIKKRFSESAQKPSGEAIGNSVAALSGTSTSDDEDGGVNNYSGAQRLSLDAHTASAPTSVRGDGVGAAGHTDSGDITDVAAAGP